jgi:hypothetical protein
LIHFLLTQEPFSRFRSNINIWSIEVPSPESGADDPSQNAFVRTLFGASFYSLDSERYLTCQNLFAMNDPASAVLFDHLFVLVNSPAYGGSGFYNQYALSSSSNPQSHEVALHELGHSIGGLGDEYFKEGIQDSIFYSRQKEPWEPNLTTLVAFHEKWKDSIGPDIPIPTPITAKYVKSIGVFEGGGYSEKGVFRPFQWCRMRSLQAGHFCPVCQKAFSLSLQRLLP